MKKLLLSTMLLSGVFVAANAELAFQYEGENLPNGAVVNYGGFSYVPAGQGLYQFKVDPEIHLVSTTDATVTVNASANLSIQLCAGGDCESGTSVTKENVQLTANTPLNLQFDWIPPVGTATYYGEDVEVPAITATLTATSGSETVSITVNMGGFTAGVESLSVSDNSVAVNGDVLNYNVDGSANLSVYNTAGKEVVNTSVSGSGSVSLENLPGGVYVYKLSGKNAKSGKFIIK